MEATPSKAEILRLIQQALREGDTYVIIQRGSYTQVGLRSADGRQTSNITQAVCVAFGLPHHGRCAVASEAQIRALLPQRHTLPVKAAIPAPKKQKRAQTIEQPDFNTMSEAELIQWIVDHPDDDFVKVTRAS